MSNTHPALARLQAEHSDLRRLSQLLRTQTVLQADALAPNIGILVDALDYLTHYPDLRHHALEDRIAERLQAKGALAAEVMAEIEAQHAGLAELGERLLRDLESALREEGVPPSLIEANVRLYAERLCVNMVTEERGLFPVAMRALDADDWAAIEAAMPATAGEDPLFPVPAEKRFAQLHQLIAEQAGCGCGS